MDGFSKNGGNNKQLNVLGSNLEPCKLSDERSSVVTGFYRDNCCNTGPDDFGLHTVCCVLKSFPTNFEKVKKLFVITQHTVCSPKSSGPVLQQLSL